MSACLSSVRASPAEPWAKAMPTLAPIETVCSPRSKAWLEAVDDALRRGLGAERLLGAGLHDGELVASQPHDQVVLADAALQPPGDGAEQRVPGGVAEGVVDRLEPVEIDAEQRHGRIGRVPGEAFLEHAPVGQPGERVVVAEPGFLGFRLPGDGGGHDVLEFAGDRPVALLPGAERPRMSSRQTAKDRRGEMRPVAGVRFRELCADPRPISPRAPAPGGTR